ncbi:ABC transporter permease [Leucobacter komagatae]|uniref:ABC transporter permease n=1 Tax=Leucobacter komagatae TaxID=55969 RepID=UPI001E59E17B|nr:ABC transporter permease subunit [Leucobacter komagatae]
MCELVWVHLQLSLPAIAISILIAIPIGRLAFRYGRFGGALTSVSTLLYAIPALPMLIIIPAIIGVPLRSNANMVIALTLYGVALLVRSAADGFASVDSAVRDSSVAIGYSKFALFWRVDLPLALPVMLAGVRVVAVSTISLVTVGALIGVSSLGTLLTDGFQRGIFAEVLTGVVATIVLALVLDGLLLLLGRMLAPWRRVAA